MTATCPHCGRTLHPLDTRHATTCIHRPGVRELVTRLMERPGAPGDARSTREYAQAAIAHNAQPGYGLRAPSQRALEEGLGGWRNVCAWVGLQYTRSARGSADVEEAALAEVAAAMEADACLRESLRTRGLPVVRVRELPDGRVACELR
jgi:hypothetical protein